MLQAYVPSRQFLEVKKTQFKSDVLSMFQKKKKLKNKLKKSQNNKERWQYSNLILGAMEKASAEFGITNFVSANTFYNPSVSSLN